MEILQLILDHPIVTALVSAAGPGVYLIWRALVAAAVRKIDSAFCEEGVCELPAQAQADHVTNRVARETILPRGVIAAEVKKKQSDRPPKG